MKIKYFDAHTHVNLAAFKDDYKEVINRALSNGVGMINVGTQADTSRRAVEIAHEFPDKSVFATVGLHPIHTSESFHDASELGDGEAAKAFTSRGEIFDYEYYKKLALDPKVVAIGECGLDYYRATSDTEQATWEEKKEKQKDAFIKQIELAKEMEKPLMIHCRSAFPDLLDILVSCRMSLLTNPGVIHFFSGTKDEAEKLLDLGFYFTFGGVITFPPKAGRRSDYEDIVKFIPMDRILSETDAPYVAPTPYRGKRNEPAYVIEVVKKLVEIKNISFEEMSVQTLKNTGNIFRIKI